MQVHWHLVPDELWQSTTAINLSDGSYASAESDEDEEEDGVVEAGDDESIVHTNVKL